MEFLWVCFCLLKDNWLNAYNNTERLLLSCERCRDSWLSHQESLCFMGMRRQFFSLSTAVMSLISAFERGVCAAAPSTLSASLI